MNSIQEWAVNAARLQFAITALYHYLFVPLTLGLSVLLGIMETLYVITNRETWKKMTMFWGKLFAINFAMGVATGITMEFQFGTNWAYYSHYVGDIFGVPLAIEGLMAFFLESTFIGLFLFGWDRMSKGGHLAATWLMAIGTNLSGLWILIANGWMQNPVGSYFNPITMRMEISSMYAVFFNEVAQEKFLHALSGGYVTGAVFVLAISSYYLIKNRENDMAKKSAVLASSFGILSIVCVIILGDESGYTVGQNQKIKLATIEAMWKTEPAPAGFTLFGIPNQKDRVTRYEIKIPYVLGLIATRSLDKKILGLEDLVTIAKSRIRNGITQYSILQEIRKDPTKADQRKVDYLKRNYQDLGYALLLKKHTNDIVNATPEQINIAAESTVPKVLPLFICFRVMVGSGFLMLCIFAASFYCFIIKKNFDKKWLLYACVMMLPLPWIANECGWIVAEYGRQPWAIDGILPTFVAASAHDPYRVIITLAFFIVAYSALLIVDVYLLCKYIVLGPDYFFGDTQASKNSH